MEMEMGGGGGGVSLIRKPRIASLSYANLHYGFFTISGMIYEYICRAGTFSFLFYSVFSYYKTI